MEESSVVSEKFLSGKVGMASGLLAMGKDVVAVEAASARSSVLIRWLCSRILFIVELVVLSDLCRSSLSVLGTEC